MENTDLEPAASATDDTHGIKTRAELLLELRTCRQELAQAIAEGGDLEELLRVCDAGAADSFDEDRMVFRREAAAHCALAGREAEAIERYEAIRKEVPADLETLRALERLYAAARPHRYLEILAALAGVVVERSEQITIYRQLAAGWEAIGELGRAAEALEWIIATGSADSDSFIELTRLYVAGEHWRAAIDAMSRHAERLPSSARAPLFLGMAMMFEEHVEDPWRAIDYYEKALELRPGNEAMLVAIARLHEATGAHERAASRLEEAARVAKTPAARTGRLTRAAELLLAQEGSDRGTWAERLLTEALTLSPGYPPAARALANLHLGRGERQQAADLLAGAVAHAADSDERTDVLVALGQVEESLGNHARALGCYRRALDADPGRREVEVRAADLLFRLGHDREALPMLERLCEDEPDQHVRAERLVRMARVQEAMGERERALQSVRRAQAIEPGHFEARRLEGELLFADGRWAAARAVLEGVLLDDTGRLSARDLASLSARIGAAALALEDAQAGLEALEQALRLDPGHLVARKRALEIYAEHGRWLDALASAECIATLEPEAKLRARYWHVAGRICAEELGNSDDALMLYRRAIEEDPDLERVVLAYEQLLTARGDRAELLAHYTARIQRLGPAGDAADVERVRLWSALADTCEAMGDRDAACVALEVVTSIDGSRLDLRARLADAYVTAGPDQLEKAIEQHHGIVAQAHDRIASYEALGELYVKTGRTRRARACNDAVTHLCALGLNDTTPLAEPRGVPAPPAGVARRPFSAQDWAALRHPDEDPALAGLWARISPLVAALEATPYRVLGLRPSDAVLADGGRPFAQAVREAARLFGALVPELYVRHDQVRATTFVNARSETALQPLVLVGTPVLGHRRRAHELLFSLGLTIANLRPERLLRLALPDPAAIAFVLEAVHGLVAEVDGARKGGHGRTGEMLRMQLTPIGFDQTVQLGRRIAELGSDATAVATRWLRGADLTAARAALAISGDLHGALRFLAHDEPSPFVDLQERMLDLIWTSTTDGFAAVREHVTEGVTASEGTPGWAVAPRRIDARA